VPVPKSEAEKLLDQMREDEKGMQMQLFMKQEGQQGTMEQDW